MANKVLIVNGSPRKKGNTAFLIQKMTEGILAADPGASVEVVELSKLQIGPCLACDGCRREGRSGLYCVVKDDMAGLYGKVAQCDALVLAAPVYWFSLSGQIKLFLDRLYGLWLERHRTLEGKRLAALVVYGDEDPYISGAINALHMVGDIARYCKMKLAGTVYGTANGIGDAEKNEALVRRACALGAELFK